MRQKAASSLTLQQCHNNSQSQVKLQAINLIDLLHDGFYLIFLIRNQYVPADPQRFREKILDLLNRF
ncbi:hypothetical protein ACT9UP_16620, partial [Acinetobacter baumannii]